MYNIQQIINRYTDHKKYDFQSAIGYLSLGGHDYYLINSDEPLNINGMGSEFITNELGQVQHFKVHDELISPEEPYFRDKEFKISVTEKEIEDENLEYDYDYFRDFESESERNVTKWWGLSVENYYIHPYYPNKKILAFELIRLLPGGFVGQVFDIKEDKSSEVMYDRKCFYITIGQQHYYLDYCLQYPEFFRPHYEKNNI